MRKHLWLIPGMILLLFAIALTGCGSGVTQADYDALLAQKTALETEKQSIQTDFNNLQNNFNSLQTESAALREQTDDLQAENDRLKNDNEALQTQYDELSTELDTLASVYPPGDFVSEAELLLWLDQNGVSDMPPAETVEEWINKGLQLQAEGLADGYIISVDYDYDASTDTYSVYCTTTIGGIIYFWDPETDEVTRESSLSAVK